jgi:hypothetical protein
LTHTLATRSLLAQPQQREGAAVHDSVELNIGADTTTATILLLRRAPRLDGPYDDEPGERPRIAIHGNLALAFPQSTTAAMPLRLVPPAGGVDPSPNEVITPAEPIPDPRRIVGPLVQAIAEVLMGARAPQQLAEVATLEVLAMLERNAGRLAPRDAGRLAPRDAGRLAPRDAGRLAPRDAGQLRPRGTDVPRRPRVSSLRVCEPRRGALEVAAVIDTGPRARAMALRLQVGRQTAFYSAEQGPLRWRCTVLRVG